MAAQQLVGITFFAACMLTANPGFTQQSGAVDHSMHTQPGAAPMRSAGAPTVDAELAQRLYRRGNTYSNLERYDEAIDEYRQAIVADPNFGDAIRSLANTYYFLERVEEAKPLYARYIEMTTEASASLIAAVATLAELERVARNFETSLRYDLKAIELDPENDSQIHVMGNTYNNAGATGKAIQIYRAGIAAMPGNAFFYRTLGRLLEQENRLTDALSAYEQAAELDPESDFYADLVQSTRARLGN
ncbi:MAG: tetratricopeptide repeat protein [Pseudohongiellaceae bacterium]